MSSTENLPKDKDKLQLYKMRHSAEHVLTQAMHNLYGKDKIIMAMGPATEDGFYFDFDTPKNFEISEENFPEIEKEMQQIINKDLPIKKKKLTVKKARKLFANNPYKQEWLDEIEKENEKVTVFWTGDNFVDLCSGPHVDSTSKIGPFKLLSIAGAYWRGDEDNKMLTRIYGTAFSTKAKLEDHLEKLEMAKKRDHKKLGKKLDLFTFSDQIGSGLPLWTPQGTVLRELLDNYVWQLRKKHGYQKVEIPHITKKDLFETSGHWDKFKDELFKIKTREGHMFAMKPMNCPFHAKIYDRKQHSYRDLPQRYANTTMVYRDEQTGELSGLSRVRCITQDDAHIFCRKSQTQKEMSIIWDIVNEFYSAVGFDLWVSLSLSDPKNPEAYMGKPEDWETSEKELKKLVQARNVKVKEEIGEAAFYGPKIDFMATDSLGREWQVATIQLDMNMPENFDLTCVNEEGEHERIVMIHAAIMGSIERYLSILIEHFAGNFPLWLAPTQLILLTISDKQNDYAKNLKTKLQKQGFRVKLDNSNKTLSKKIALAIKEKPPYIGIIGSEEKSNNTLTLKNRQDKQTTLPIEKVIEKLSKEVSEKTLTP